MDTPLYLLFGALILALLIGGPFLRTWLKRKASQAGRNAGERFAAAQLVKTLDEFGATLVIHAPEGVTRKIVADVVGTRHRDFSPRSDGDYGIRFTEADDTIVCLVADTDGTRMQVETFREYIGFPQTAPLWKDLRSRVAAAAGARGIAATEGPTLAYHRGALIDEKNARWTRNA